MFKLTVLSRTLVLVPLLAHVAAGQNPSSSWDTVRMLAPGTAVRIVADNAKPASGNLTSVNDTALVLNGGSSPQTFDKAQITSVAVKKNGHRVRNTLIGLAVGLAAGLGIGAAAGHNCTSFLCGPGDVIVGGMVGTAGGTVGGLVWPTGGWRIIYRR